MTGIRPDAATMFDRLRADPFKGRMTQGQVEGIETIIRCWTARMPEGDPRQLAYCLATAFHETAGTMAPVRETLAASDDQAIARLDRAYAAGRLGQVKAPYWRRDGDGKCWLGRGLVQITHRANYVRLSRAIGIDLVAAPERALERDVAAAILVAGMTGGLFTGAKLDDFIHGAKADWTGARRIVNGTDRAARIATIARGFSRALGC